MAARTCAQARVIESLPIMKTAAVWLAAIAFGTAALTSCDGDSVQHLHDVGGSKQSGGSGGAGSSATTGGAGTGGSATSVAGGSGSGGELVTAGAGGTPPVEPSAGGASGEAASALGGAAGSEAGEGAAGAGGDNPSQAGTGSGGSVAGGSGAGGTGDTDPGPDPCEGMPAWDSAESWTEYEVGEQRLVNGELWHCQAPMFCHTYPGHPDAPGWFFDGKCNDPGAGGEPACQCADGECCDGCYFLPRSHFCGEVPRYGECNANGQLELDYWNLFCNGDATVCSRWAVHTKDVTGYCDQGTSCEETGDMASCVPN